MDVLVVDFIASLPLMVEGNAHVIADVDLFSRFGIVEVVSASNSQASRDFS